MGRLRCDGRGGGASTVPAPRMDRGPARKRTSHLSGQQTGGPGILVLDGLRPRDVSAGPDSAAARERPARDGRCGVESRGGAMARREQPRASTGTWALAAAGVAAGVGALALVNRLVAMSAGEAYSVLEG